MARADSDYTGPGVPEKGIPAAGRRPAMRRWCVEGLKYPWTWCECEAL